MLSCSKCGAALLLENIKCESCGSIETGRMSGSLSKLPKFDSIPILAMLALFIVTGGLYSSMWFLLRRRDLKKITPAPLACRLRALIPLRVLLQLALYGAAVLWVAGYRLESFVLGLAFLLMAVSMGLCLLIRRLLRLHASRVAPDNPLNAFVAPSVLATCLWGSFYVQFHINRLIEAHFLQERI